MTWRRTLASLWLIPLGLASGCAPMQQPTAGGPSDDLRRLVMETRREVQELRKDQEQLRSVVEYLQYSAGSARAQPAPSASAPSGAAVSAAPPMFPQDASAPTVAGADEPVPSSVQGTDPTVHGAMTDPGPQVAVPVPVAPNVPIADPMIAAVTGGGAGTVQDPLRPSSEVPTVPADLRGSGYDEAVRAFVEQQYEDSIQYFRNFIHADATSSYADDAQYWIGESYLRKGMYSNAIKEFNQVVLRYGSGDRAAPALLKLAQVFSKIGDQVDARLSLQKLVNRYPGTPEATQAYSMLQQMGG
jgi:tol-pal system protein YbgF